jgi:CRP-like cAMP-binding protein
MVGFGEIALLLNQKRTATIIAYSVQGCDTWTLSADVFKYIIA